MLPSWVPRPSKVHNLPHMKIPKSAQGSSYRQNAGGVPSRVEGGTMKSGGFKGGGRGSGSKGKIGPGDGPQGNHPKGTRRSGKNGPGQKHMGFREPR